MNPWSSLCSEYVIEELFAIINARIIIVIKLDVM